MRLFACVCVRVCLGGGRLPLCVCVCDMCRSVDLQDLRGRSARAIKYICMYLCSNLKRKQKKNVGRQRSITKMDFIIYLMII